MAPIQAVKVAIGKLDAVPGDLVAGIGASGFAELPVSARHAARVVTLPKHHRDPFDRVLVAQAIHEPLHLLTADAALRRYSELVVTVSDGMNADSLPHELSASYCANQTLYRRLRRVSLTL